MWIYAVIRHLWAGSIPNEKTPLFRAYGIEIIYRIYTIDTIFPLISL